MSQLLINSVSLISSLSGCLVYSSPTKIFRLSYILYPVNIIETFVFAILFLHYVIFGGTILSLDFEKSSTALHLISHESKMITIIKSITTFVCQITTLIGSWSQRKNIAKSIEEAREILKAHERGSILSWKKCYQIFIYPALLITRFAWLASTGFFENSNSLTAILFKFFIGWALMAPICTEGQFAALASVVEMALIDINQRIEDFGKEEVGDHYQRDCHLGENYPLVHPFFQYQEIIPSHPINIRSSLINFQLNKSRGPNQLDRTQAEVAYYQQYSDSMGGLNCQLLPLREEIRNRRDARIFDPFLDPLEAPEASGVLETFKAIGEEKQPARNQFATESKKPAPLHLLNILRLRSLSGKISPPKRKLGEVKSTRITVGSKDRNSHLERVEGTRKRCEMRELTKQHSRVARLAADLSKSFHSQMASSKLYVRVNSLLNLYLLVRYTTTLNSTCDKNCGKNLWKIAVLTFHLLFRLFNLCQKGQSVILQDQKIRGNLLALSRRRFGARLVQEVEVFLTQVELSPIEFKADVNTRFNMALFFSFLFSVLTSTIILIQFSGSS